MLNSARLDLDLTVSQFIAKKQLYFDAYIKQKLEIAQKIRNEGIDIYFFLFKINRDQS